MPLFGETPARGELGLAPASASTRKCEARSRSAEVKEPSCSKDPPPPPLTPRPNEGANSSPMLLRALLLRDMPPMEGDGYGLLPPFEGA